VNDNELRTVHGIGIEVHGGRAIVLIPAGSRTPVARAMTFTTVTDGQLAVEVRVVRCGKESDRPLGVVGRLLVPRVRTGRRGEARIDIGISLDRDGVLRAWGADRSSGVRQEATFAGLWALGLHARPGGLTARLTARARSRAPAREGLPDKGLAMSDAVTDGSACAALAGEIDGLRRWTAEPPVRP